VSKYIEQGMSSHDAAVRAMNELFGPIIGITLVLMAVFLPSAFISGLSGQMFAQFALVIAATALISAINAATLKPTQCALWLRPIKPVEQRNFFFRAFERTYSRMEKSYTGLIARMVRFGKCSTAAHGEASKVNAALLASGMGMANASCSIRPERPPRATCLHRRSGDKLAYEPLFLRFHWRSVR
jgi:multidrug efflux pump subunit AcrB